MIEIDKKVPVPPRGSGGIYAKYPFCKMEVGDSFFAAESANAVCSAAYHYRKRHKSEMKFTVRTEGDGVRCWRIE